jgi:RHS repeat-associated protein
MTTQLGALAFIYTHHPLHGYLTKLPHLEQLDWSFKEEIIKTIQQKRNDGGTAETTYYQYDGGGQRIRKITENTADVGMDPTKKEERIYFSGYETYRTYAANTINFERETLSLIDQGSRFIMIETVKQNTNPAPPVDELPGVRLTRYQLHNHLGSAALELDDAAQVISYEEYHPFGTTAYQAMNATIKAAAKRYRFTGMERDEETGLEYHSARYYIPFLGRWCSADPIGIGDGVNVYCYCKGNAVMASDKSGNQSDPPDPQLNFYQCSVYQTNVTATYSSRGISETLRATYTGLYRTWTGDYSSTVDVGHMGTPFVFLRAGDVSPVGPQLSSENRSDGAGAVRSSVGPVRSSGGFARVDGIDTSATGVASKGARYPANPLPASLANPRLAAIGRLTAAPATTPLIVLPASTSGGTSMAAPSGPAQLSFPFAAEESPQMSFNFSRSAPIVNSSSAPPPLPIQTTQASAQLELDFSPAPAPRSGGSSSGGSGGGRSWPTMGSGGIGAGGLGALGRSTPVVGEGVFLTESALMTGAYYTASSAPAVSSALITAAEATPVIAGVGIVGAGGGHVVRYVASEAGASQDTADALGFGGAVAIGAGLGSVVPGVGTAVGAVAGGLVAGGIYLFSIW